MDTWEQKRVFYFVPTTLGEGIKKHILLVAKFSKRRCFCTPFYPETFLGSAKVFFYLFCKPYKVCETKNGET